MRASGWLVLLLAVLAPLAALVYLYIRGPALLAPTYTITMAPPAKVAQLFQQRTFTTVRALLGGQPARVTLTEVEVNQLLGLTASYRPAPGAPLQAARVRMESDTLIFDSIVQPDPGLLPAAWRNMKIGLRIRFTAADEGGRLVLRPTRVQAGTIRLPTPFFYALLDRVDPGKNPLQWLEARLAAARQAGLPISLGDGLQTIILEYSAIRFDPVPVKVTGAHLVDGGLVLTLARN